MRRSVEMVRGVGGVERKDDVSNADGHGLPYTQTHTALLRISHIMFTLRGISTY